MSNTPIELKGSSFTLSVVHLHDANPEVIRQALEDKIAQLPLFTSCSGGGEYRQHRGGGGMARHQRGYRRDRFTYYGR